MVIWLTKGLIKLPKSLEGIKSILILPLLFVFFSRISDENYNIPIGQINLFLNKFLTSFSGTNEIILLGVMMVADLGDPINKAAYVFYVALLEASINSVGVL